MAVDDEPTADEEHGSRPVTAQPDVRADTSDSDTRSQNGQNTHADTPESPSSDSATSSEPTNGGTDEFSADQILSELRSVSEQPIENWPAGSSRTPREEIESTLRNDAEIIPDEDGTEPLVVRECKAAIGALETKTRNMLAYYREFGPSTPLNAHFAAGGNGDRTNAYAHNRELRTCGLIEHVGRGHYDYCLREYLVEELDDHLDEDAIDAYVREIEETTDI